MIIFSENVSAKQTEIAKLLDSLESVRRVDSDNNYQDIVTDIANVSCC